MIHIKENDIVQKYQSIFTLQNIWTPSSKIDKGMPIVSKENSANSGSVLSDSWMKSQSSVLITLILIKIWSISKRIVF